MQRPTPDQRLTVGLQAFAVRAGFPRAASPAGCACQASQRPSATLVTRPETSALPNKRPPACSHGVPISQRAASQRCASASCGSLLPVSRRDPVVPDDTHRRIRAVVSAHHRLHQRVDRSVRLRRGSPRRNPRMVGGRIVRTGAPQARCARRSALDIDRPQSVAVVTAIAELCQRPTDTTL